MTFQLLWGCVCQETQKVLFITHELETKCQLQKWGCHFTEKELPLGSNDTDREQDINSREN